MSTLTGILNIGSALRSPSEEFVGALTHGIGLALSVVGGGVLVTTAALNGDLTCSLVCKFYALTLIAVYAASTLSHLYLPERLNRLFRSLDQGFIYLLIVGTFTPFALTYLTTPIWLCFYVFIMAIGVIGFLSKTLFAEQLDGTGVWLYVALGWGESIAILPMIGIIPAACLLWVAAGGVLYTVGAVFLIYDVRRYHFHAIWHLLVIAGSVCHYVAILRYVAGGI